MTLSPIVRSTHLTPDAAVEASPGGRRRRKRRKVLLLVLDGLRPDSIDARSMPNLARLAARGVTFTRSRTGFPSETMVGAGELMSGAYPERSGITSNWMPVPGQASKGTELKSLDGIDTMAAGYGGRALAATSLFQALASVGMTSAFIGKEGPAELAFRAGATWAVSSGGAHESETSRQLGARRGAPSLAELVRAAAGEAPGSGEHDDRERSAWLSKAARAVDAALGPDLLAVWMTDPDRTQHGHGLRTSNQASALRRVDAQVGALLVDLERRGVLADTDIVVTSDHGFSDHIEANPERELEQVLKDAGLKVSHVVGAGNNHMVRFEQPPTSADFAKLRAAIAASPFAGQVETVIENPRNTPRDSRRNRRLTGRDLRQGSERGADAYVIYRRDDSVVTGKDGKRRRRGAHVPAKGGTLKAGHGSLGWTDLNNTLLVSGPSFEQALPGSAPLRTPNAAGIVDVAPTILHLLGAAVPSSMQGRVLREALAEHGAGDGVVDRLRSKVSTAWSNVRLGERLVRTGLVTEHVGGHDYFVGLRTDG